MEQHQMMELVRRARLVGASDIHLSEGADTFCRIDGKLCRMETGIDKRKIRDAILSLLTPRQKELLENGSDLDFAFYDRENNRQRVNVFRQRGDLAATIRILNARVPSFEALGLPDVLLNLAQEPRGLILITGPTGSGKTTTLAAIIDYINQTRNDHIITIEDPIEYLYEPKSSLIHQREVGSDATSFSAALRSALREDPDVILVGEMRDYETISAALIAAETGHLVLSTLHTTGTAQTVDRIIDVCPPEAQSQVRTQLAGVLKGIVTQCLIPEAAGKGRVVATEVLVANEAVLNTVREAKTHQIPAIMQSGRSVGMHTLNQDLLRLYRASRITRADAYHYSNDKKELMDLMN